jgi:hypothetical protein
MATNTARKQGQPEPGPQKTIVGTEPYSKTFYRPVVNGKTIDCEHYLRYGHDNEKAALACARHLAAAATK